MCIFCNIKQDQIIFQNDYALVIRDNFPVTPLHSLVIPKRHIAEYFDMTDGEILAINNLTKETRKHILNEDSSVKGFNIGINVGQVAGQTIFHSHIHIIPRRDGDVEDPRGGIRNVIIEKGNYLEEKFNNEKS